MAAAGVHAAAEAATVETAAGHAAPEAAAESTLWFETVAVGAMHFIEMVIVASREVAAPTVIAAISTIKEGRTPDSER